MRKDIVLYISLAAAIIIIITLGTIGFLSGRYDTLSVTPTPTQPSDIYPTTDRYPSPTPLPIQITDVSPGDKATNVSLNTTLTITFSKTVRNEEIMFSIAPEVAFVTALSDKILTVSFPTTLTGGTRYTYIVKYPASNDSSRTYTFTTKGTVQNLPDTQPAGMSEREDTFQKSSRPDVFLSNYTPYEGADFMITSEYKTAPGGHFAFIVKFSTPDSQKGRTAVWDWIKGLGLSEAQIQGLDIRYQ